jgi:hypothetical protein
MLTIADLQRFVEETGATVFLTIAPEGLMTRPEDTVVVSAGNSHRLFGPTLYGNDLTAMLNQVMAKAPTKKSAQPVFLDL